MALQVNLEKATQALVLSLEKAGVSKPPVLEVGFGLDVSGSFEDEHRSGVTNDLMTRLVPWGLAFDPDKKLDVFTFSNGERGVHNVGSMDAKNYDGFVADRIIGKVPGWNGGTDYSYLLDAMLGHFGWKPTEKKPGLFGRLMGQKSEIIEGAKKRSLIIVATDGDNFDKERTLEVLRASEERQDAVYFLFLGISNQGGSFPFIQSLGRKFDNTGFVSIRNLGQFVQRSDEELNQMLIGSELVGWLKQ